MEVDVYMCIKKVACGLKKVKREDGREILEPIFVEVETPEDMHRITSKIESCKTITPKVVGENAQEGELVALTVTNEHDGSHGDHGGHGGATINDAPTDNGSPITDNIGSPTDNGSPTSNGSPREIVCIETGEVFANATQASKETGIARQHIGACCNGKRKKAGGYQWKYL